MHYRSIGNSSAFGFLLQEASGFKVAFSEPGAAFSIFTPSHMTNQQVIGHG